MGSYTEDCTNETIESLWKSNRAFRIFNLEGRADLNTYSNFPDVIRCADDIVYFDSRLSAKTNYKSIDGSEEIEKPRINSYGGESGGLSCNGRNII